MQRMRAALPRLRTAEAGRREVMEFSPRVKAEQAASRIVFDALQHPEHTDADDYECDKCVALACAVVDEVFDDEAVATLAQVRKIVLDDAALSNEMRVRRIVEALGVDDTRACTNCNGCEGCQRAAE